MANDFDVLRQAYQREEDVRNKKLMANMKGWTAMRMGVSRSQITHLMDEGYIKIADRTDVTTYQLTDKGRKWVEVQNLDRKMKAPAAGELLEAMAQIVGFDDLKEAVASGIASGKRIHFLLSGPPACAKSLFLEAVRSTVETAFIVFGSRTSASGLSEVLFEHQPTVLLMDEADKLHMDTYSVLLGLMESGEILETKSGKTRGIKLNTMVMAACNKFDKMPREFLSRFALHASFPEYTRDEFIDVCRGFLPRLESCTEELAEMIGKAVFDYGLGDVRKARGVCQLMNAQTEEEVQRVVQLMKKYSADGQPAPTRKKPQSGARLL